MVMINIINNHLKKVLLSFLLFLSMAVFGQSPSLINYQGTARLADGTPLDNRAISVRFEILLGSASATPVATETQTIQTNALGLFSTLIGQGTDLSNINWRANSVFLRVAMDTSGGNSFVEIGVQRLVSVPYAIHASSVPSSYTNNILSIGSNTYALSPTVAVVPNTSITVSGLGTVTSAGTNSFDINIPAPTFSNTGQTIITGTYPDFTVNTPTVPPAITPSIAITNTIAATSTVVSSGSSFSLNVPPPTFTNVGPSTITGAYPNFTINSSSGTTYTNGTGIGLTSGSIIVNTSPNITPTVALTTTAAAAAAVASSGSSFSLNVPPPTFTNSGPATITGAYPNFTINSTAATTYTNGAGIALTSGSVIVNTSPNITPTVAITTTAAAAAAVASSGSSFSLNVPPPTFANSGPATITGAYPNFTINSTAAPSYTSGTGISITSGSINNTAPDQTVTFNNTGQTLITGTYPSFSISTPTVANTNIVLTSTAAAGPSLTTSGTNSFNINIPTTNNWSLLGNAGTSTVSNFIGTTDNVALNFRVFNQQSGVIDPVLQNSMFGFQSGSANTTGNGNSGLGYRALFANTSGNSNSAVGYRALSANTTGGANSAFGSDALLNNTTGIFNIAFGLNAGRGNTTGNNNTALGRDALYNNSLGSNNVAIGYQAGYYETGSNKLYISNSSSSVTPLIYGDFSTNNLGIGTTTANAPLQFNNNIVGRKIVLWEGANNDHQVYGFGVNINTLRYQVDNTVADHAFFAGVNATTSQELMRIKGTGNVGIGTSTPNAPLQFSNSIVNRKVVLYELANNDHQYYGLGINNSTLRYQVPTTADDHVFYAGNGATSSNEVMRVKGNGLLKMGSETGTGQGAQYPSTAGGGLLMRRLFTSITTVGEVVARTDQMTLERDGTSGGWRVNRFGGNGDEVCNCMGTNNLGVSVNRVFNNLASGVTQVYTNADNIVYFRCMFGDPYAASHITEVMFTRMHTDYFWVGTVTTTFNQ